MNHYEYVKKDSWCQWLCRVAVGLIIPSILLFSATGSLAGAVVVGCLIVPSIVEEIVEVEGEL